jgi:hypothetical protein
VKKKRCPWCGEKCIQMSNFRPERALYVQSSAACSSCNRMVFASRNKITNAFLVIAVLIDICFIYLGISMQKPIFMVAAIFWLLLYVGVFFAIIDFNFSTCLRRLPLDEGGNIQKIDAPYSIMVDRRIKLLRENIFLIRFSDIQLEKLVTHRDLIKDYRNGIPVYVEKRKDEDFYRFGMLKPEFIHNELIIPGTKFELIDDDVIAVGTVK